MCVFIILLSLVLRKEFVDTRTNTHTNAPKMWVFLAENLGFGYRFEGTKAEKCLDPQKDRLDILHEYSMKFGIIYANVFH